MRWNDIDWRRVRRVTVVPYGDDVQGWVLARGGQRLLLPSGAVGADEGPKLDAILRIPLEVAGFRRQAWYPLAQDGGHLQVWAVGARYRGAQRGAGPEWWHGAAVDAAELLRAQGDDDWAEVVLAADRDRAELTDAEFYEGNRWLLEPAYLAGTTPQQGSGFNGPYEEWRAARSIICDAIDQDGTFLDVGCANGYLMECVVDWSAEKGVHVEPYGMDLSAALVAEARRRRPQWADRLWVGNAINWIPPAGLRFDVVHTLIDCVPDHAHGELLAHLLHQVVAPAGRLVVSSYVDISDTHRHAAAVIRRAGLAVDGETRPAIRAAGRASAPSAWIVRPAAPPAFRQVDRPST